MLSGFLGAKEDSPFYRYRDALSGVQDDFVGFNTGNGEKLSYSQGAGLAWLCLAVAYILYISGVESSILTLYFWGLKNYSMPDGL